MKSAISTVVFDLGRVLVDFNHRRGCRQVSEVTGVPEEHIWKLFFEDRLEFSYEEGLVSTAEVLAQLRGLAAREFSDAEIWRAGGDIFTAVEGMHQVVQRVKSAGMKVALLSNTNEIHWKWVEKNFAVVQEFEHLILSYQVRSLKPKADIYHAALKRTESTPGETLFIDDLAENIAGARALGWQGVVFESPDQLLAAMRQMGIKL